MRVAQPITLEPAMRNRLTRYSQALSISPKLRVRSRIVLLASEGQTNKEISSELDIDQVQVGRWRKRFAEQGLPGITKDKTRPGRIKSVGRAKESEIIHKTLHEQPVGSTHWSRSTMAKEAGVSESTVGRIWARNRIEASSAPDL